MKKNLKFLRTVSDSSSNKVKEIANISDIYFWLVLFIGNSSKILRICCAGLKNSHCFIYWIYMIIDSLLSDSIYILNIKGETQFKSFGDHFKRN